MNATAHIVVPYLAGGNQHRRHGFNIVRDFYREQGWPIHTPCAVTTGGVFNKAASINTAVLGFHDDSVLVLNDADSLVPAAQLEQAVTWAREGGLVIAYDLYLRLDQASSERVQSAGGLVGGRDGLDGLELDVEWELQNAPSPGVCAILMRDFRAVGGLNEGYVGWGYEDLDFVNRCARLGPVRRVPGPLWHLWHDERRPDDSPLSVPEGIVYTNHRRYREAWCQDASIAP